jgi:multicomponent Na+:H+ antiporter subunit G
MSLEVVLDVAAAVCLTAGALLSLSAGIALIRFPDLMSRMHAATKPQVLGLLLVLLGCALRLRNTIDVTTLVLVGLFQLATAPVGAHMIGRSAYRDGQVRTDLLITDELAAHAERMADRAETARDAAAGGP